LRNALDYLPRKADDDCLTELRWFYERRNVEEARRDLIGWLGKWQAKYPRLCEWVEGNIEETFTFYFIGYPRNIISISKAPTRWSDSIRNLSVVPTSFAFFPNPECCLRLIQALAVEMDEDWLESHRYLNMEALREQRKTDLQDLKAAA